MLFYVLIAVVQAEPLYQPRYFIPLAGMIFANAMTAISLAGERFDGELSRGVVAEKALSTAFNTAMIPQVNAFFAVGLVSLPGMMTGQIIAGVDPLLAIRYQIVVMAMIFGSAGLAVAIFLYWEKRHSLQSSGPGPDPRSLPSPDKTGQIDWSHLISDAHAGAKNIARGEPVRVGHDEATIAQYAVQSQFRTEIHNQWLQTLIALVITVVLLIVAGLIASPGRTSN